jgi:hypothetical protein
MFPRVQYDLPPSIAWEASQWKVVEGWVISAQDCFIPTEKFTRIIALVLVLARLSEQNETKGASWKYFLVGVFGSVSLKRCISASIDRIAIVSGKEFPVNDG